MQRLITGYRHDDEDHWIALLSCGHPQHVRHQPPLKSRPWVLTEEGRLHIGTPLVCVRCDRCPKDCATNTRQLPVFGPAS